MLKELLLGLAALLSLINYKISANNQFIIIALFCIVALSVVQMSELSSIQILSARKVLLFPCIVLTGAIVGVHISAKTFSKAILFLLCVLMFLAFIERFVLFDVSESFWRSVGLDSLLSEKGRSIGIRGVPNTFYTWGIPGYPEIRRMVGLTTADPVQFGYLMALGSLLARSKKARVIMVLFICATILTLAKGAILVMVTSHLFWYFRNSCNNIILSLGVTLTAVVIFAIILYQTNYNGALQHLTGYTMLFDNPNTLLFGNGIGSAGNFVVMMGSASRGSVVQESYWAIVIFQIGLFGLMCYLFILLLLVARLRNDIQSPHIVGILFILSLALSAIGSEVPLGSYLATIPAGLLAGMSLHKKNHFIDST